MTLSLSIIIPAYNEEKGIAVVLSELVPLAEKEDWEVLVVDDCSQDNTAAVAEEFLKSGKNLRLIRNSYNKGYGGSIKTGISASSADLIVTMDADGQHDPKAIKELIEPAKKNVMVVGKRDAQSHQVQLRKPGKKILGWVADYLVEQKIPDLNSGLRVFHKKNSEEFSHLLPNSFSFSTTITLAFFKTGYDVLYIPITVNKREGKKSSVKYTRHGAQTFLLILRIIMLFNPLKIFAPMSALIFSIGILYALFYILNIVRFPTTAVFCFLAGLITLSLGLLADQISSLRKEK